MSGDPEVTCYNLFEGIGPCTYDHRVWKTGLPVRSAVLKPHAGELVVGWVTTSESSLFAAFDQRLDHRCVSVLNCKVHGGQPMSIRHGHRRRSTMHEQQLSYLGVSQSGSHVKRRASVAILSFYVCNMSQQYRNYLFAIQNHAMMQQSSAGSLPIACPSVRFKFQ
ncbi:L-lysine 2-3-aminomutase [Penicillium coprophilum]|uniref:L-lysine 2-3-aminomutase n=1 Tax=Penicillium coprophilum TaxID=36646 RepID=UPI002392D13F|nr:L-lysine 2-3-aminomutase [Penicillium coprophilum]KAJ5165059.1 L-lysine 2-3-aminomutase [Penicillium coprophilum]